ncbi:MAG: S1 RNA-binding domain-containing protein [Thermodesulfobacterium sp.]|nr:S1 RNA-binding domain-containing protein [Caldimicrobium sp.]MDW8136091.1 S1 RNA-binding domain-containing protein [Thermodesulfobacterium sp.]
MEDWIKDLEAFLERRPEELKIGDRVKGVVVQVLKDWTFVDIGLKKEVLLPTSEITREDGSLRVKVGEEIEALVVGRSTEGWLLSYLKLREKELWEQLRSLKEKGKPIEVKVLEVVKGGYKVEWKELLIGFMPLSQSYFLEKPETKEVLVGKSLEVEVLKIEGGQFVVSRRTYLEKERERRKKLLWEKIKKGEPIKGEVKQGVEGGFLVELEGVLLGFLPFKELSWARVKNPQDYLKVGDKIEVKAISWDEVKEKIKLSLKALLPDPWKEISQKYKEGERVRGRVSKIFPFGAFVELEPGIEGLIPLSEFSWKRSKIEELLKEGDLVEVVILSINPEEKRLTLSLKKLEPSPWEILSKEIKVGSEVTGKVKSITGYGMFVEIREGVDGFVHISQISWDRIENLREFYKEGDEVKAQVLEIDPLKQRLTLSIKNLKSNPWEGIEERYKVGDIVEGKIKKILEHGLLLEIEPELSAWLPFSELIEGRKKLSLEEIKKSYPLENKIKAKIILIDRENRKIRLSHLEYLKELEKEELREYQKQIKSSKGITLGDILRKLS